MTGGDFGWDNYRCFEFPRGMGGYGAIARSGSAYEEGGGRNSILCVFGAASKLVSHSHYAWWA